MVKTKMIKKYLVASVLFLPQLAVAAELKIKPRSASGDLEAFIVNIINYVLGFAFALAVLFVVIGGVQYMTAGGNEDKVTVAKKTLTYAIIGIIVIILALFIVNTVQDIITKKVVK